MLDILKEAFWHTCTSLVELIVPIIAIWVVFNLIATLLFGRRS